MVTNDNVCMAKPTFFSHCWVNMFLGEITIFAWWKQHSGWLNPHVLWLNHHFCIVKPTFFVEIPDRRLPGDLLALEWLIGIVGLLVLVTWIPGLERVLRESGGFLRCFFCEGRASLTIEKKQNMFLSWEMFILPWKIMFLPWENGAFAMENICFDHGKLWFDHGKRCFDHGRLWFWHGKSLILRWEIVLLFYHDLIMGNNVFSMGKGEFTTKHGCVVGGNSDVIGRQ